LLNRAKCDHRLMDRALTQAIESGISRVCGEPFRALDQEPVGGGCINRAVRLKGRTLSFLVKLNRADRLPMFEAEAAGLEAIRRSGALRSPRPVASGVEGTSAWLALEFIDLARPRAATAAALGTGLAALHRTLAPRFGWERDNTIGAAPQPNAWSADWVEFLRRQRLGFQLDLAQANGLAPQVVERGRRLLDGLPAFFRDYRPAASLLHGDLWSGNWAADREGRPVIFDPAVYYGDREADLAMTELFGRFDEAFYRAYREAWPPDPGYRVRRDLYNLYHLLNHYNLFGAGYAAQAGGVIERLLSELG